jgi:hypothetical protein
MRFAGTQGIVEPEKLRDDFFNAAKLLIAMTFAAKSLFGPGKGDGGWSCDPFAGTSSNCLDGKTACACVRAGPRVCYT